MRLELGVGKPLDQSLEYSRRISAFVVHHRQGLRFEQQSVIRKGGVPVPLHHPIRLKNALRIIGQLKIHLRYPVAQLRALSRMMGNCSIKLGAELPDSEDEFSAGQ